MSSGILLLAGGLANRFGADKRMAVLPSGKTVIETVLATIRATDLPYLVCIRHTDRQIAALLRQAHAPYHACQRATEGMGGTLAEGVGRVPHWDALLVALADMPWVPTETYQAIASATGSDTICVPTFEGRRGHPVGFGSKFYAELSHLTGDRGARALLEKHPGHVTEKAIESNAILRDIDVPQDIQHH